MTPAPRDQLQEGGRGGGRGKTVGWRPPGASAPSDAPSAPWQVAERAERVLPRAAPHRAPRPACHLLPPVDEGVRPRRARNFAGNVEPVGGGRDGEAPLQTPRNPAPSPRRAPSREPLHRGARGPRRSGAGTARGGRPSSRPGQGKGGTTGLRRRPAAPPAFAGRGPSGGEGASATASSASFQSSRDSASTHSGRQGDACGCGPHGARGDPKLPPIPSVP